MRMAACLHRYMTDTVFGMRVSFVIQQEWEFAKIERIPGYGNLGI
jgi:hypothetical protein